MDIYRKLGNELRLLFKELFIIEKKDKVREKMIAIQSLAAQIGGSIQEEAEQLNRDLESFLQRPHDHVQIAIMKKHALRLEQETREI